MFSYQKIYKKGGNMSRIKTHEEYVNELKIKNPNLQVIGKYQDAKTKIVHKCMTHNIEWEILPSNALKGRGCSQCRGEKIRNKFTKSHDDYVKQLNKINPYIVPLEKYIGSSVPILHLCKLHNIKWKAIPSNLLKGQGCIECGKEKFIKKIRFSHEEYIEKLKVVNPNVEVIEHYLGSNVPILHKCLIHNVNWNTAPSNVLSGKGCPKCRRGEIRMKMAKSHADYVKELAEKNPTVEVTGKYVNGRTKIQHHCLIHNIYWDTVPSNVLKGCGCPKCLAERITTSNCLSNQEYIETLQSNNANVISMENYVNIKTPILHKCLIHNYEWKTSPASVLQGCGCPECGRQKISCKIKKTHKEYVNELKNVNPDIVVIEKYIDSRTPILHKCLIHDYEWKNSPIHILSGTSCPLCHESRGERFTRQWLEDHNIRYEREKIFQDCKDEKPLPFDFYLPDFNLCIEYQGKQHYEPIDYFGGKENLSYVIKHDNIKEKYCKDNGITLLQIPYYKNTEKMLNNFI